MAVGLFWLPPTQKKKHFSLRQMMRNYHGSFTGRVTIIHGVILTVILTIAHQMNILLIVGLR